MSAEQACGPNTERSDGATRAEATLVTFWAKLGKETWPEKYHPVICHLIDVGQVTRQLWDRAVRQHVRGWIKSKLGLADESAAGSWLGFWAAAHDIGKITPGFQYRCNNRTEALRQRVQPRFDFPIAEPLNHGAAGTAVLAAELTRFRSEPDIPQSLFNNIAVAVGGHHGVFPTNWDSHRVALGNTRWAEARFDVLSELARLFDVQGLTWPRPATDDQSIWMFVAGLTSVADWIGSNVEFFPPVGSPPLLDSPFNVDEYFSRAGRNAGNALEKLGWLRRANQNRPVSIGEFLPRGREPRPLQTAVAEIVTGMSEPSLLIVEAPMGEGKTEAAWYAAACWNQQGGQGAYVALPTMATSNQMFERVGKFLEADAGGNLMLLHGKAALNEQFEKLMKTAKATRYASGPEADIFDEDSRPSAVVAEGWFAANKKHGLLAPYGVGTVDQALLAVLQTKHVFVRLFGLAGKCVILDEVHAYDAYMTTLMERLLRWLAALGCPVVLLSATLPRDRRQRLIDAYAPGAQIKGESASYPRITVVHRGAIEEQHIDADPGRARTVGLGWLKEEHLADQLRASLYAGGCAVVIRNTVRLAQDTYLQLRDALEDDIAVELFHARFPFGRRKQIEDDALKAYGRTEEDGVNDEGRIVSAPHRPSKSVLVATQVVEQSLDLDFDVMISDVAPIDLVLQRAGRLHRHDRGIRPSGVTDPRVWLIEPEVENGVPDFGVGGIIYSPHVLFRSMLSLRSDGTAKRDKFRLPAEIDVLVDQVYEDLPVPDSLSSAERDFWERTRAKHSETIGEEESEAESRQIKKPQFRGALVRVVQEPREEDSPDLHPAHQALTRLTRPTVSLVCLERDDNGPYRLPHDNTPVPKLAIRKMSEGGSADVGRLMLGEITSAHSGVIKRLRAEPCIPPEWVEVGMLCRHHLILFSNGKARLGEYELSLDNFVGLTISRVGDQGEDE
jgi:CRISPR-associated endonuclease/helicase Cas3